MSPKTNRIGFIAACSNFLLIMILACSSDQYKGYKKPVTDQSISDAIEDELRYDRAIQLNDIEVHTTDGIVTLTGNLPSMLAKERAARLATIVKGVKAVNNSIDVIIPWDYPDNTIQKDIIAALLSDPATSTLKVSVAVQDGVVTLDGSVDAWPDRHLVGLVAMSVFGVTYLNNRVVVKHVEKQTDRNIVEKIKERLRWDALVDHALISTNAAAGKVILTGKVGSLAEKYRARWDAHILGVTRVDISELKVEPWHRTEDFRKEKYTGLLDKTIEEAIGVAFSYNPRIKVFEIIPSVAEGKVTLRGRVSYLKAKQEAAEVARNIVGTTRVINRIRARPYEFLPDTSICAQIQNALLRDAYLVHLNIFANVSNGVAVLSGTVDHFYEKAQAEDVASRIPGVREINNRLKVLFPYHRLVYNPYVYHYYPFDLLWGDKAAAVQKSDNEILDDVLKELWWSPFISVDQVNVSVSHGIVTLIGEVQSQRERNAAIENAYQGGAAWVYDNLLSISAGQ